MSDPQNEKESQDDRDSHDTDQEQFSDAMVGLYQIDEQITNFFEISGLA